MQQIVQVHYPDLDKELFERAMKAFFAVRDVKALKKKPSTSELIDWIKLLLWAKVSADDLKDLESLPEVPPFMGSLLKNEQDNDLYQALRAKGFKPY
jgi:MoxR-like ATPase